jgi:ankyrin repeat protein
LETADTLLQAVSNGASFEVLSCLVKELGVDVNRRDDHGCTALAIAAFFGYHDTVRYLVEELGANVNIRDNGGRAPLSMGAGHGHLDVVRVLLKLRADIDVADDDGETPLMAASVHEHYEIVKWLVKAGADTQIKVGTDTQIAEGTSTAAKLSREVGASAEQTAYLEAKTHCSNSGCSGAGIKKCTGCKQARYCGEACQLGHWKAHKADCRRWSAELAAEKGK